MNIPSDQPKDEKSKHKSFDINIYSNLHSILTDVKSTQPIRTYLQPVNFKPMIDLNKLYDKTNDCIERLNRFRRIYSKTGDSKRLSVNPERQSVQSKRLSVNSKGVSVHPNTEHPERQNVNSKGVTVHPNTEHPKKQSIHSNIEHPERLSIHSNIEHPERQSVNSNTDHFKTDHSKRLNYENKKCYTTFSSLREIPFDNDTFKYSYLYWYKRWFNKESVIHCKREIIEWVKVNRTEEHSSELDQYREYSTRTDTLSDFINGLPLPVLCLSHYILKRACTSYSPFYRIKTKDGMVNKCMIVTILKVFSDNEHFKKESNHEHFQRQTNSDKQPHDTSYLNTVKLLLYDGTCSMIGCLDSELINMVKCNKLRVFDRIIMINSTLSGDMIKLSYNSVHVISRPYYTHFIDSDSKTHFIDSDSKTLLIDSDSKTHSMHIHSVNTHPVNTHSMHIHSVNTHHVPTDNTDSGTPNDIQNNIKTYNQKEKEKINIKKLGYAPCMSFTMPITHYKPSGGIIPLLRFKIIKCMKESVTLRLGTFSQTVPLKDLERTVETITALYYDHSRTTTVRPSTDYCRTLIVQSKIGRRNETSNTKNETGTKNETSNTKNETGTKNETSNTKNETGTKNETNNMKNETRNTKNDTGTKNVTNNMKNETSNMKNETGTRRYPPVKRPIQTPVKRSVKRPIQTSVKRSVKRPVHTSDENTFDEQTSLDLIKNMRLTYTYKYVFEHTVRQTEKCCNDFNTNNNFERITITGTLSLYSKNPLDDVLKDGLYYEIFNLYMKDYYHFYVREPVYRKI